MLRFGHFDHRRPRGRRSGTLITGARIFDGVTPDLIQGALKAGAIPLNDQVLYLLPEINC